jgi:antitoxin (DNA-binding transcriptional repressor) of toxin-antitoxin stability system
MDKFMQAGKFKAQCLKIMDSVKKSRKEIIITKHRMPIVKLCPIENSPVQLFGKMAGTVHIKGDILLPIEEEWDANR